VKTKVTCIIAPDGFHVTEWNELYYYTNKFVRRCTEETLSNLGKIGTEEVHCMQLEQDKVMWPASPNMIKNLGVSF
jgi:hypothetical protein